MLTDAIRSESYRLSRNRGAVFWGVLFVPIVALLMSIINTVVSKLNEGKLEGQLPPEVQALTGAPIPLLDSFVDLSGQIANPGVLLFLLIAAVTVFAGDYRWETWRLIAPRNTRPSLILGKVVVVAALILVATLALFVGDVLANLVKAFVSGRGLTLGAEGPWAGKATVLLLLAWARTLQFLLLALLAAVVTRSLLASLFVPIVVSIAQAVAPSILPGLGLSPDGWVIPLLSATFSYDALKTIFGGDLAATSMPAGLEVKAITGFALWAIAPLVLSLLLFSRQGLSKE